MQKANVIGSCLCERVAYEIKENLGIFHYCHCSRCRKFTGSAFASNMMVDPECFSWVRGEEFVERFEVDSAAEFATSFCKKCGSSLPWLSKSGKVVVIPAGTLDSDPGLKPTQNIFCGSSAAWYTEPSSLLQHDELPKK